MPKDTTNIRIDRMGNKSFMKLFEKSTSLREIAEGMEDPNEALQYVIAAYENVTGSMNQDRQLIFEELNLTAAQATIFNFLYQNQNKTVTRNAIIDCYHASLSRGSTPDENGVNVFICNIRQKIKGSRFNIETVWGVGYRLTEE